MKRWGQLAVTGAAPQDQSARCRRLSRNDLVRGRQWIRLRHILIAIGDSIAIRISLSRERAKHQFLDVAQAISIRVAISIMVK